MSTSANKNKHRRESKRYGHKQARQLTRHVLEDAAHTSTAHGVHWAPIEQPPIHDEAVVGPVKNKKKGCKRNKYGPHVLVLSDQDRLYDIVYNEETKRFEHVPVPWFRRRYRPPFVCKNCHKSFYRVPKRGAVRESSAVISSDHANTPMSDHYDMFNIKMRLLGLKCKCLECRDV